MLDRGFTPGHDVSLAEWGPRYIQWIYDERLHLLPELEGKTLVCDCSHGGPCEADILAGIIFEVSRPAKAPVNRQSPAGKKPQPVRRVSSKSRASLVAALPQQVWSFSQETIIACFAKLFPGDWFLGFRFPMIEDLANSPVFMSYLEWRHDRQMDCDGPLGPLESPSNSRARQRHAEGV